MALVQSSDYLHESACGLQGEDHVINSEFVSVIEHVVEHADFEIDYGAAGCGSCFTTDAEAYIFWVAQNDADDSVMLNYGADTVPAEQIALRILESASELGVAASWNSDTNTCVCLGRDDYYENLDPGVRVENERGLEGTVLDPGVVNYDMTFEVREETEGFGRGDVVARFDDRELADEFAEGRDLTVHRAMTFGTSDGDNIVQFDGHEAPSTVKTSSLRVL